MRLSAAGVCVTRGGRAVLADVGFTVAGGEALVVVGRNGAGKTTLLRAIAGLLPLDAGTLVLEGGMAEASLAEQTHFVGHRDAIKSALTVAENLTFWQRYYGGGSAPLDPALAAVGIDRLADLPVAYLSAGQRRRLTLARLLVARRPLWLLDEPTAALDQAAQTLLTGLMRDHLGGGGLIVAATHGPLGLDTARSLEL
jgi:heme exporter protein A